MKETNYTFDKFMDDIVVKEQRSRKNKDHTDETPQRKYVRLYTDRAVNKIKVGQ